MYHNPPIYMFRYMPKEKGRWSSQKPAERGRPRRKSHHKDPPGRRELCWRKKQCIALVVAVLVAQKQNAVMLQKLPGKMNWAAPFGRIPNPTAWLQSQLLQCVVQQFARDFECIAAIKDKEPGNHLIDHNWSVCRGAECMTIGLTEQIIKGVPAGTQRLWATCASSPELLAAFEGWATGLTTSPPCYCPVKDLEDC